MKAFLSVSLLLLLVASNASAEWRVRSDYQLQLPESTLDTIAENFRASLSTNQSLAVGQAAFAAGSANVQVSGVHTDLSYQFAPLQRLPGARAWSLKTRKLGARTTVDQMLIRQRQTRNINGIDVGLDVTVECHNIILSLPESAGAGVSASMRAEALGGQLLFSLSSYQSTWPRGAWKVESLQCPQLANIQGLVQEQLVQFLANLQSTDPAFQGLLQSRLASWGSALNAHLLSARDLPSIERTLKISQEPKELRENGGIGLLLAGKLNFLYPLAAQEPELDLSLPPGVKSASLALPQLLLPFSAVRGMLKGEFLSGRLQAAVLSTSIPSFTAFQQARLKQLFAWPDLLRYPEATTFLFHLAPLAPSTCLNESSAADGAITCDLDAPLKGNMFAPLNGSWIPYVEFRSDLSGRASFSLEKGGKVSSRIAATQQPVNYSFTKSYVDRFHPNTHLAADTLAAVARDSLSKDGLGVTLPKMSLSPGLRIVPQKWKLLGGAGRESVLAVDFAAAP